MNLEARQTAELSRAESLRLLGSVSFGRIAFTHRSRPTVRPVNHLLDDGKIIIRTHPGSDLGAEVDAGALVAYEADEIDPDLHLGWSVVATGRARAVSDPDQAGRYRERLPTWVRGERDLVLLIEPAFVTGIRLVEASPPHPE